MRVYEDNQATAKIIRSGKFPKLGHVHRCHGVQLSLLTQELNKGTYVLEDCHTKAMKADIFTKYFTDKDRWRHAQLLIGMSEKAHELTSHGLSCPAATSFPKGVSHKNQGQAAAAMATPESRGVPFFRCEGRQCRFCGGCSQTEVWVVAGQCPECEGFDCGNLCCPCRVH